MIEESPAQEDRALQHRVEQRVTGNERGSQSRETVRPPDQNPSCSTTIDPEKGRGVGIGRKRKFETVAVIADAGIHVRPPEILGTRFGSEIEDENY